MQTIKTSAEWLVCRIECIPGVFDFSLTLPIVKERQPTQYQHLFKAARASIITDWQLRGTFERDERSAPQVGKPAPDFVLPGHDGKSHQLSQHKGKFVVLEWFNNECPYVGKHYDEDHRNMQSLQKNWIKKAKDEGKELVWFSIISSAPGRQGYATAPEA